MSNDPVVTILNALLSNKGNMDLLLLKYQKAFLKAPITVTERLIRMLPRSERDKKPKDDKKKKPLGLFVHMSDEAPAAKPIKRKR
jgi:hypothetical protein